jgi:hypothetical protein
VAAFRGASIGLPWLLPLREGSGGFAPKCQPDDMPAKTGFFWNPVARGLECANNVSEVRRSAAPSGEMPS